MGVNSFFHFGTNFEFLENICNESYFRHNFLNIKQSKTVVIESELGECCHGNNFIEYSKIDKNCFIGENCILSRIYCKNTGNN